MKKKIISLCLIAVLLLTAIGGATLAYFTDTDKKDNTFTTGKVDITLNDKFEQNSKLVPAVEDKETHQIYNAVDKVVSVTNNDGSEEAFVRVHIAVPASIDELIGLWYSNATGWNWSENTRVDYTFTLNDVKYNAVCLTYSEKMAAKATTTNVFEWVVLDPDATNEDVAAVNGSFDIKVVAEGCQAAGFSDAFAALEAAFGTPSAEKNPWNNYGKTSSTTETTAPAPAD